tara:strand:+ start:140 stop:478 length:339 start_codon:yes stop_codon:yes gene_type:complete
VVVVEHLTQEVDHPVVRVVEVVVKLDLQLVEQEIPLLLVPLKELMVVQVEQVAQNMDPAVVVEQQQLDKMVQHLLLQVMVEQELQHQLMEPQQLSLVEEVVELIVLQHRHDP